MATRTSTKLRLYVSISILQIPMGMVLMGASIHPFSFWEGTLEWTLCAKGTCLREEPSCHRRGHLVAPEVGVQWNPEVEGAWGWAAVEAVVGGKGKYVCCFARFSYVRLLKLFCRD